MPVSHIPPPRFKVLPLSWVNLKCCKCECPFFWDVTVKWFGFLLVFFITHKISKWCYFTLLVQSAWLRFGSKGCLFVSKSVFLGPGMQFFFFFFLIETGRYRFASDLEHNCFLHNFYCSTFTKNSWRNNLLYVKVTENLWQFLIYWPCKELCDSSFFMFLILSAWRQWIATDGGPKYVFSTWEKGSAKPGFKIKTRNPIEVITCGKRICISLKSW